MYMHYTNDRGDLVGYVLDDWEAALSVAQTLVNAPIDIEYTYYEDGVEQGVFNLNTFEKC